MKWAAILSAMLLLVEGQNTAAGGFPCRSRAGCGSLYPDYKTPEPPPPQLRPVDPACPQCPYQTQSDQGYFPNTPSPAPSPRYYAPTVTPTPGPTEVGDYTAPYSDRNPPPTPLPSGATPKPPTAILCTNVCSFGNNGQCEDGGPGTTTTRCRYGEDCSDCGARPLGGVLDQNGDVVGAPLVTTPPTPIPFITPTPTFRTPIPFPTQPPSVNVPFVPSVETPRPFFTARPTPVPTAANWQGWNQFPATPPPVTPNTIQPAPNAAIPLPTNAAGVPIAATPRPTPTPPVSPVVPISRQASPEPTPAVVPVSNNDDGDDDNKLAIIIALAVVAGLLIIGLVAFFCLKRSKKNKQKKETDAQLQQIASTGSSFGSPYDATTPGYSAPPQFTYGDALEMSPSNANHYY
eukprot:TRINITY_DN9969_c0_g1_i1.p1 TRINITY_DN9969_c0_g1~~TRINITY_DN9969_c0_g1_i1.p1  ORF type:complete len:404 (+),score=97.82 TRINITY_DN9969_c0_g1_i1:108-1319(+)